MSYIPKSFQEAVKAFSQLPSIGQKSAQRMVMHLLKLPEEKSLNLAQALIKVKQSIRLCESCHAYSDDEVCSICLNPKRDHSLVCVVENPTDIFAIEESAQFQGVYHVLHGRLSPLEGVGPEQIKISQLFKRIEQGAIQEVILAMNPDVEGDATALYIANKLVGNRAVKTSRIAMGVPMGSSLEYTDQITLGRAIAERRQYS
ncbi:MAG TPA: recombination mediator RecR [Oligoflexia bacterium]|nr:recombination mediator RecR [Oligoflexia bacterium]HMR24817.1 recombination mediator RecR [Oligoflexia bacterium]